jgi:hypothetical protein
MVYNNLPNAKIIREDGYEWQKRKDMEAATVHFKVLVQHLPAGTEENHGGLSLESYSLHKYFNPALPKYKSTSNLKLGITQNV